MWLEIVFCVNASNCNSIARLLIKVISDTFINITFRLCSFVHCRRCSAVLSGLPPASLRIYPLQFQIFYARPNEYFGLVCEENILNQGLSFAPYKEPGEKDLQLAIDTEMAIGKRTFLEKSTALNCFKKNCRSTSFTTISNINKKQLKCITSIKKET